MGKDSKIEWCDHTFNPWIGCEKVGPGCKNCYAERDMTRKPRWANCWGPPYASERLRTSDAYWKQPFIWDRRAMEAGRIDRVFCASLADVFEDNPKVDPWRNDLFRNVIFGTPSLEWLILTKRPRKMLEFCRRVSLTPNVSLGTSVSEQRGANERVGLLLAADPYTTFLSVEPMLGPIDLVECGAVLNGAYPSIDWVIIGCESGPKRRPLAVQYALDLVEQCDEYRVPVFVKQLDIDGRVSKEPDEWPEKLRRRESPYE